MEVKLHRSRNNDPVLELVFHHLREVLKLLHRLQKPQHRRQHINQYKVKKVKPQIIQNGANLPAHPNKKRFLRHQQLTQAGYNFNSLYKEHSQLKKYSFKRISMICIFEIAML